MKWILAVLATMSWAFAVVTAQVAGAQNVRITRLAAMMGSSALPTEAGRWNSATMEGVCPSPRT
jgi:hypothetical protein